MFNLLNIFIERRIMSALSDLQAAVTSNTRAIQAIVAQRSDLQAKIGELEAQVASLQGQVTDEAALVAMTTELNASLNSLG